MKYEDIPSGVREACGVILVILTISVTLALVALGTTYVLYETARNDCRTYCAASEREGHLVTVHGANECRCVGEPEVCTPCTPEGL